MASGYLLRKFRELRGLTQKEVGEDSNLNDVRIRQYELDLRTPKEETLNDISEALDVNPEYLKDPVYPYNYEQIIRTLFKLEDSVPMAIGQVDVNGSKVCAPIFLGHNIMNINTALDSWARKQFEFMDGKITLEEYEDWKANWPDSTKEDYVPNIINKKQISYDEYLAEIQARDEIQARNEIAESAKKRYQDFYIKAPDLSDPKKKK